MIKVLIVEDDPMVAQINSEYIQRVQHFEVIGTVYNGSAALEFLNANSEVNLVLLDVYMPKMNGMEMLEELRRKYHDVDVIFVTAAKERKMIQRGLQLGAVDYLIKPFTYERIKIALEKYQQRYSLLHENEDVSQDLLDNIFKVSKHSSLPKGIHELTLERIKASVDQAQDNPLQLQRMSEQLSISVITLRFYLDYMVSMGLLIKKAQYGAIGRPTFVYCKKGTL